VAELGVAIVVPGPDDVASATLEFGSVVQLMVHHG